MRGQRRSGMSGSRSLGCSPISPMGYRGAICLVDPGVNCCGPSDRNTTRTATASAAVHPKRVGRPKRASGTVPCSPGGRRRQAMCARICSNGGYSTIRAVPDLCEPAGMSSDVDPVAVGALLLAAVGGVRDHALVGCRARSCDGSTAAVRSWRQRRVVDRVELVGAVLRP